MASYVVKIQYEGNLRRLTLGRGGELAFSYAQLENRTRDLLHLESTVQLVLTYVDKDGDVVTMAGDDDVKDALVVQSLNPLRLNVATVTGNTTPVVQKSSIEEKQNGAVDHASLSIKPSAEKGEADVAEKPTIDDRGVTAAPAPNSPAEQPTNADDCVTAAPPPNSSAEQPTNAGDCVTAASAPNSFAEQPTNADDCATVSPAPNSLPGHPTNADDCATASPAPNSSPGQPTNAANESSAADATNKSNSRDSSAAVAKENGESVIHYCVGCDLCGQTPLSGPRFKSRRRPNYDLCLSCFESSGADLNDYFKIDRRLPFLRLTHPSVGRMMRLSPALDSRTPCAASCQRGTRCDPRNSVPNSAPKSSAPDTGEKVPFAAVNVGVDPNRVLHGGVQCDGCGMSPLAGPRFLSRTKFNYDLCLGCFEKTGCNACEFALIDNPVRSHPMWGRRMMRVGFPYTPTGHIWILNQLAEEDTARQAAAEGKTAVPAGDIHRVHGEVVNRPEPVSGSTPNTTGQKSAEEPLNATPSNEKEEGASVSSEATSKAEDTTSKAPVSSSANSGTEVDTGEEKVSAEHSPPSNVSAPNVGPGVGEVKAPAFEGDLSTRGGQFAKLEAMGFTDQKLNSEILERNNFDLRRTLEDLVSLQEWDPVLEELEEMGFYDSQVNRRLLFKNNGSIKLVVKELVQSHKNSEAGKGKVEKQE